MRRMSAVTVAVLLCGVTQAQVIYYVPATPTYYVPAASVQAPVQYYVVPTAPVQAVPIQRYQRAQSEPKTQIERYYFLGDADQLNRRPISTQDRAEKVRQTIIREYYYVSADTEPAPESDGKMTPPEKLPIPPAEQAIGEKANVDADTEVTPKNSTEQAESESPPSEQPKSPQDSSSAPQEGEPAAPATEEESSQTATQP